MQEVHATCVLKQDVELVSSVGQDRESGETMFLQEGFQVEVEGTKAARLVVS